MNWETEDLKIIKSIHIIILQNFKILPIYCNTAKIVQYYTSHVKNKLLKRSSILKYFQSYLLKWNGYKTFIQDELQ